MTEKKTDASSLKAFDTANALAAKYLQNPQSIVVYVYMHILLTEMRNFPLTKPGSYSTSPIQIDRRYTKCSTKSQIKKFALSEWSTSVTGSKPNQMHG